MLAGLVGIVDPGAGPGLKLGAGLYSRRLRYAVPPLAGVGGRAEVHIKVPMSVDLKGVHRMIAGERQSRDNHLRRLRWHDFAVLERVTLDLAAGLRV